MAKVDNIVVTGKSGAGKQPRIDVLVDRYGLEQLSTGNIFRSYLGAFKKLDSGLAPEKFWDEASGWFVDDSAISAELEPFCEKAGVPVDDAVLGLKAARFVDAGLFVPDRITNALFEAAFRAKGGRGLVLDGYPRTAAQAEFLLQLTQDMGTKLDLVLLVDNEDDLIVQRTVGRRICPKCGRVYHVEYKPPKDGKYCHDCGVEVIQRSDDTEEKIRTRLREFAEKTAPAIELLRKAGIPYVEVPGNLPVFTDEAVRESVLGKVEPILG